MGEGEGGEEVAEEGRCRRALTQWPCVVWGGVVGMCRGHWRGHFIPIPPPLAQSGEAPGTQRGEGREGQHRVWFVVDAARGVELCSERGRVRVRVRAEGGVVGLCVCVSVLSVVLLLITGAARGCKELMDT